MTDIISLPTLHSRLLADCLADVATGELVRIGPAMPGADNRARLPYWRRRGCLTWVDAAHAVRAKPAVILRQALANFVFVDLVELVSAAYVEDLKLFRSFFHGKSLMDQPEARDLAAIAS